MQIIRFFVFLCNALHKNTEFQYPAFPGWAVWLFVELVLLFLLECFCAVLMSLKLGAICICMVFLAVEKAYLFC